MQRNFAQLDEAMVSVFMLNGYKYRQTSGNARPGRPLVSNDGLGLRMASRCFMKNLTPVSTTTLSIG